MAATMTKTRHPGIYRRGSRYIVRYRAGGAQRQESARTLDEALRVKRSREADRDRGEFQAESRLPFRAYAEEWVERYQGRGRGGFRESTRDDYRRDLANYAYPFFDDRLKRSVTAITPRDVAHFIAWVLDAKEQGRPLSDSSARRILAPVRSCLGTAVREGLIRHNPATGAALPHRPKVEDDEIEVKAFTREQLAAFLELVHPNHRTLFRLLAATGLRWSEVIALRWQDLVLDGSYPVVKVRRALVRGRYGPPKSKHSRRDIPLDPSLVSELRRRLSTIVDTDRNHGSAPDALVFTNVTGSPLDHSTMRRRYLRPVAEEIGAPWAGFHTFRHTAASMLFERGANAVMVQRWLGHHSPAFTLATYVHLLDDRLGEPLELVAELASQDARTPGIAALSLG